MGEDETAPADQHDQVRRQRFGRLPGRVLPYDTEESVDTRTVQDRPASAMNSNQVAALFDGA
ncbi:hypothetical protein [Paractinoplanes maris]|uniref:hypothetical protein n=1 Tax=Paractinoplanes maris TaxID=1734446 RepID=UPI00202070A8|nr:hypothetical protein [Actinoplanes maris]